MRRQTDEERFRGWGRGAKLFTSAQYCDTQVQVLSAFYLLYRINHQTKGPKGKAQAGVKEHIEGLLLDEVTYSRSALGSAALLLRSDLKVKVQRCCKIDF